METIKFEDFERGDQPAIIGDPALSFTYGAMEEAKRQGWRTGGFTNFPSDSNSTKEFGLVSAHSYNAALRTNIGRCDAVIIFANGSLKLGSTGTSALDLMINTCKERHRRFRIVLNGVPPIDWLKQINPRVINIVGIGSMQQGRDFMRLLHTGYKYRGKDK